MNPTGSFERFQRDVLSKYHEYGDNEYITFGILIADSRQSCTKEYILNYIDMFNEQSGRYFDFFIPGYIKNPYCNDSKEFITIDDVTFYFSYELFKEFLKALENRFKIRYTFNPMLILMSMKPGNIRSAEYIIIELDNLDSHDVKRAGLLFREIFDISKHSGQLNDIQTGLKKTYMRNNCLSSIISALGPDWLVEVKGFYDSAKHYRIKSMKV